MIAKLLSSRMIAKVYMDSPLEVPGLWNLSRKHIRLQTIDGKFLKLNHFENRINARDLKFYCFKLRPVHVYFSVLNWLFPERVGRKCKARYAIPLNGEYIVDIDSYLAQFPHVHRYDREWGICERCLNQSRISTLYLIEVLEKYYNKFAVVFSGRSGFHVHVLDFNFRDWVSYREDNPIWCHSASRFRLTRLLNKQVQVFDRYHFNVSVDPMRMITVPNTINGETGLRCTYLGDGKAFAKLTIPDIINCSKLFSKFNRYPKVCSYSEHLAKVR